MPLVDVPEFATIHKLLYGGDYCVTLGLYGPIQSELSLADGLSAEFGGGVEIRDVIRFDWPAVIADIMHCLGYPGSETHGPYDIDEKMPTIGHAIDTVVNRFGFAECDIVTKFVFRKGHPAYPVFWDFAYDLHAENGRYILIGSSSD